MIEKYKNTIICEDVLSGISKLPDNSINCVITSPPYWQLRDYGYPSQWGLEPTFDEYLDNLWKLMDEIWRVLKNNGTVWVNLGDTYNSAKKNSTQGTYSGTVVVKTKHTQTNLNKQVQGGIAEKCLLLIPHRFAIGCIERGWIMRNDIIWAKRNGMPESVTDRFSKKHEYFFFMVKQENYYFNLDAVRDKHATTSIERAMRGISENNKWVNGANGQSAHGLSKPRMNNKHVGQNKSGYATTEGNAKGKNPGTVSDFWDIPTKGSSTLHYASYNDSLIAKPILAGCPEGGIILDPFMGTGSTAEAALRAGRNFIGIDASEEYCKITTSRLEPFFLQTKLF